MGEDTNDDNEAGRRRRWNTDPMADYPVGPDDAGNVVMHAVGFIVAGWRWIVGKTTKRS